MKVDVVNMQGEKVQTVDLPPAVFEAPIKPDLMHQALVRQLANARLGTHKTKTRSEVSGGGRKPWRQKGTGRARQGSTRAPQWVGGGNAHTPQPRDYSQRMPRKMRHAALRSALSVKASQAEIVVLDELRLEKPKTKEMAAILGRLVGDSSALIILTERDEQVERSVRNLPAAKTLRASYL
jgi:large subunit ribosomal protein L4